MIVVLDYNLVDECVYWSDNLVNVLKWMLVNGVGGVDMLVW